MPKVHHTTPAKGGIYAIRHVESGKLYIGSAVNFFSRWRDHRVRLNRGDHHSRHLQGAWDKYGAGAFVWEIVEAIASPGDREQYKALLRRVEQGYLDHFRPWLAQLGYNISPTAGSYACMKHSAAARAKISARMSGRVVSAETRAKISATLTGRKLTEEHRAKLAAREVTAEHRAKLSKAHKGRKVPPEQRWNRKGFQGPHSPESRAKMSKSHTGEKQPPEVIAKRRASLLGGKHTDQARANMARAQRLRFHGPLPGQMSFGFGDPPDDDAAG